MKFGNKILNKSVPEWKLHNIDYEKLKRAIKQATVAAGAAQDAANLERCTQLFREQFTAVNVFTALKVKEISARLVAIERSIINFKKRGPATGAPQTTAGGDLRARQLKLIARRLDECSTELQRLSRFLILQKIALGKLFKKFVKHYPGGATRARAYVAAVRAVPELTEGYEGISFTRVDLDPYLLEVSLIVNVLQDVEAAGSAPARRASGRLDSSLAFDTRFWGDFSLLQRLLVSSENVEEFKFMILNHGFHMVDDEIISTSRGIRDTPESLKTVDARSIRSARSFKVLQPAQPRLSLMLLAGQDGPVFLRDDAANQHPDLVVVADDDDTHCVVMCHVGGLRGHLETGDLAWRGEPVEREPGEHHSMAKLAIEWIQSRRLQPVEPRINFKRTRFICVEESSTYLIALDEDITVGNERTLPHALVEIRKSPAPLGSEATDAKLVELCEAMIENKTQAYPLSSNLTLWRLCFALRESKILQADLFDIVLKEEYDLENERPTSEDFFLLGRSSILKVCSETFLSSFEPQDVSKRQSAIHITPKEQQAVEKPRVRYWNEFDDDPEFYNDTGFYVDNSHVDDSGNDWNGTSDYGFIVFNKRFIDTTYRMCQNIRGWFGAKDDVSAPILAGENYGAMGRSDSSGSVNSANSLDDMEAYLVNEADESGAVYEYRHDQVITFMYMSSLFAACVTSGISFGVILALFHVKDVEDDLEIADLLIVIISLSLVVSLVLICSSLLLLFSRYKLAPVWHYVSCFILFLLVVLTVCYGFTEVFF